MTDHEEDDDVIVTQDTVFFFDKNVVKVINIQPGSCPCCNKGMQYKDFSLHIKTCPQLPVSCTHDGCQAVFDNALTLTTHMSTCGYKPMPCRRCKQLILQCDEATHALVCDQVIVDCPNDCGIKTIVRANLDDHVNTECPKTEIPCPVAGLGCTSTVTRSNLAHHMANEVAAHTSVLVKTQLCAEANLTSLCKMHTRTTNNCLSEMDEMKREMAKKTTDLITLGDACKTQQAILDALQKRYLNETQKLSDLTLSLQQSKTSLGDRLADLEEKNETGRVNIDVNLLEKHHKSITHNIESLCVRMACLETVSYDGTLLWKISNYAERRKAAEAGLVTSLFSQPFFTSRTGYKLCARTFLNGDGIGKTTHMSIFLYVMKGEYDVLLTWPLCKRVQIALLRSRDMHEHTDSFQSHDESPSIQRPTKQMNVGSGFPLFITQSALERDGYMFEDSLFIKVTVKDIA